MYPQNVKHLLFQIQYIQLFPVKLLCTFEPENHTSNELNKYIPYTYGTFYSYIETQLPS